VPEQVTGEQVTGGDLVAAALEALGVECVFGIVSVHNLPIYDAIRRRGVIRTVNSRHEQGAVHAADGYARATGKLGVAITSTGPGAANAVPGLYEAGFSSSPVLMITGQVETRFYGKGRGVLHEAERQLPMLRSVTRRTESVTAAEDIPAAILLAAASALTGRPQPVAVEIPIDLQYQRTAPQKITPPEIRRSRPDAAALATAAAQLSAAERPLLWAGGGVVAAGASAELTALAERLQAPVVTTVEGRGAIAEDHPLAVGPHADHAEVAAVIADADVVLAVGTRFPQIGGRWVTLPPALIHLDADPRVIGLNHQPAVELVGDARAGLGELLQAVDGPGAAPAFTKRAQEAAARARADGREMIGPDHRAIMDAIRELLPREAPIVRDSTIPAYRWGDRLLPILAPRTSVKPNSAAIGPGVPLAIGAAAGSGQPTVLIQGDGGLMLSVGELATVAETGLPIVVCVFNDRGYGVLRWVEGQRFEGANFGVDLHTPDFVALGRAMGLDAELVTSAAGFKEALGRAVAGGRPTLLEIDQSALAPMGRW
jgi:acetolactate synthase-1/2/3 large subunit